MLESLKMKFRKILNCRCCNSSKFRDFFNFGEMELSTYFPKKTYNKKNLIPLEVVICQKCKLFQLKHNYDLKKLFNDDYGYRSGINQSMKDHFQTIIDDVKNKIFLNKEDVILDIASNDGTLLSMFKQRNLKKIGIDPTIKKYKKFYKKDIKTSANFFNYNNYLLKSKHKAKLITSIAVFYDVHKPNSFVRDVSRIIAKDGMWILEQSYLPLIIKNFAFDSICHEHVTYFTFRQLKLILDKHNLKIIDCSLNSMNGGSIRFFITPKESKLESNNLNIKKIVKLENLFFKNLNLNLLKFSNKITKNKIKLLSILKNLKNNHKKIHVYGASTKGNILLQYFKIDNNIVDYASDRNKFKWTRKTPGTNIPIISENKSRKLNPDYYFVLPWHFKKEFIAREKKFLNSGGKFIFPLPNVSILKNKV